jgi:hypothetical protein
MSANYPNAITVLQPLALAPTASPRERQTLALIYGTAITVQVRVVRA